jgi:hypothetical protein
LDSEEIEKFGNKTKKTQRGKKSKLNQLETFKEQREKR